MAGSHEKLRRDRKSFPPEPSDREAPTGIASLNFHLQNHEKINACCKSPSSWYLAMAALANLIFLRGYRRPSDEVTDQVPGKTEPWIKVKKFQK